MTFRFKVNSDSNLVLGFSVSVIVHFIIFILITILLKWNIERPVINTVYLHLAKPKNPERTIVQDIQSLPKEKKEENELVKENFFYNFSEIKADTSDLQQVYRESTLDVTLKYPNGWTYIDQNVKNKLDGITFWLVKGNFPGDKPPPYIHLEVKEKYLFNPARFKYKMELNGNMAYYNDPEELEGQISQVVYIRTNSDEDYSLKLIIKGRDEFKSFQPVFFSIIKSFKFGESFF
jgi:hypothetical protein